MSLYRFTSRNYAECFLQGIVSFGHWNIYKDDALTDAQIDDENKRKLKANTKNIKIVINGKPVGLTGFEVEIKAKEDFHCYILSLTTEFNTDFFGLFKADSCIEIINEREFLNKIDAALKKEDLGGYCRMVEYYAEDNLFTSIKNYLDIVFKKNNKYAYQKEYRFAAVSPNSLGTDRLNIAIFLPD